MLRIQCRGWIRTIMRARASRRYLIPLPPSTVKWESGGMLASTLSAEQQTLSGRSIEAGEIILQIQSALSGTIHYHCIWRDKIADYGGSR